MGGHFNLFREQSQNYLKLAVASIENFITSERCVHRRFRYDLLARIDLWFFELPGLAERPEDIEPNLDYELEWI